jgi:hypothetical protein
MNLIKYLIKFIYLLFLFLLSSLIFSATTPSVTVTITPVAVYDGFATNGPINAITRSANVLYLGGSFTKIGKRVGSFYFCDLNGNQLNSPRMPQVDGAVYAIAPDGSGGFYIGGTFSYVGGLPRTRLAHILNTGQVDPNWTPSTNSTVRVIRVGSDNKIYIGGSFTSVTGTDGTVFTRNYLAALDPVSGNVLSLDVKFNGTVFDINFYSNYYLIVGGSFTTVNSLSRPYLALIDPSSGIGSLYSINYGISNTVYTIARPSGSIQTYIGGAFTWVNGTTVRNRIAMYSTFLSTTPTSQDFNVNGTVYSLHFENSNATLYATGNFTRVNGGLTTRNYAAAFNTATAQATSFNPDLNNYGNYITSNGTNIYIGGAFERVNVTRGSVNRLCAASFDKTSGNVITAWVPDLDGPVYSIAPVDPSSFNIAIGGSFRAAKTLYRNNLASVNILNDVIYAWDPNVNGTVYALALTNTAVYAGGTFTFVNGSIARNRLASFDLTWGTANSWDPNANDTVYTLLPVGTYMYIGGGFTSIGGAATTRNYGAAVNVTDGTLLSWNPDTNGAIKDLCELNGIIYAGGYFTKTGGGAYTRNYAAAFSLVGGVTQSWDPNCNGYVYNVEPGPGGIYLGGAFTTVSSQSRNRIACVDTNGNLTSFAPTLDNSVYGLYINNNTLIITGIFSTFEGVSRPYAAAYDLNRMKLSDWQPNPNAGLFCATSYENRVALGGYVTLLSYLPHGYGAIIECPRELYTPTATNTRTFTRTSTRTPTPTITNTFTPTPTFTSTSTPSITSTRTATPTNTPTFTKTSTPTVTFTNVPVYSYPFFDTFATHKDWDYGPEWQRGPAIAPFETPGTGYPDSVSDVSSTSDNYIAGTVIGGNMSTALHPYYYLTSPYIDASSATQLQLRFYRYLNCDWAQYISATVEVYDGTSWIQLFINPNSQVITDNQWNEFVYDVTPYKSSKFRVRFGHSVNLAGAYTMSGWNIDDVYIGHPFTPTITVTFTVTPTSTYTYTRTATDTYTATPTFTSTNTPTNTQTYTPTNTPTFTSTVTLTVTPTGTPTITQTSTRTYTLTFTNTATNTSTNTPTFTRTYTLTNTPTFTYTATPTFTSTPTITLTFTISPTFTNIIYSATITPTHSISPTITQTGTWTRTLTFTPTDTLTDTPTITQTGTPTNTPTHTPTYTYTDSPTYTYTNTPTNTSTVTPTNTPTNTFTNTSTYTFTHTSTPTYTGTFTQTVTLTQTNSHTQTSTITPSNTFTPSSTHTNTERPTGTFTKTPTITETATMTITQTSSLTVTLTYTNTITPTQTHTFTLTLTETPSFTETFTFTYTITETPSNTWTSTETLTPTPTETLCMAGIFGNASHNTTQTSGGSSLYASRFELLQDASVRKIYVYIQSGTGMIIAGIYTDLSGQPDSLYYPISPKECVAGWNEFNIPFIHLSAGYYWLAIQAQSGIQIGYLSGVPMGSGVSTSNIFGTLPDPFGDATPLARLWSIYAEFCPDIGYLVTATVTPTNTPTFTITLTPTNTLFLTSTPTVTVTPAGPPVPKEGQAYVYPLPADSKITFVYSLTEEADVTIYIFDFAGNLIKPEKKCIGINSNINRCEVDINNLTPGIYYYLIKAKTVSGKEIKFKLNKFIVKR